MLNAQAQLLIVMKEELADKADPMESRKYNFT